MSGGGIDFNGTLILTDSTISENRGTFGGGIHTGSGTIFITNTTIANNTAFVGGGLFNDRATIFITNATIANNTASTGNGLFNENGQIKFLNTILARNTSPFGHDCAGPVTSRGHNLIGDPSGCTITLQPTDLAGDSAHGPLDPGLGPFTDTGVPGRGYFPLLSTSPAIDAGNKAACPKRDQLGERRHKPCDMGAIEFQDQDDDQDDRRHEEDSLATAQELQ